MLSLISLYLIATVALASLVFRAVHNQFFHPLSRFPGPLLAKQTYLWKAYQIWTRRMPPNMQALHEKYGPIVRIGPNDLNFSGSEAVVPIFKSGRTMPKSAFYDGFTTFKANLFGTRDEDLHALRRRQMAHGFSSASLKTMEGIFDRHLQNLRDKIDGYCTSGEAFDLKAQIAYYAYDVLGELAFSTQFNSQKQDDPSKLPPINDHIFLACIYGSLPGLLPYSMRMANSLPFPWLRSLLASRKYLRDTTFRCVSEEIAREKPADDKTQNLLTSLISAKDPESGQSLTKEDICTEAFAYIVAGSHTTSGTLTLLFYHLLHSPDIAAKLTEELTQKLESSAHGTYPYTGLESRLSYATACIQENYRITPVFTMPLARVVTQPGGMEISSQNIPPGTVVSMVNYCLHHNAQVWGDDHDTFRPERWTDENLDRAAHVNNITPFGAGHRACIGRNVAAVSVVKVLVTLWRNYEITATDRDEKLQVESVGIDEKAGPLMATVRRRL